MVRAAQQKLRGAVPNRDDDAVVGERAQRAPHRAREAEICDLNGASLGAPFAHHEHVGRLQIPVDDPARVERGQAGQKLEGDRLEGAEREGDGLARLRQWRLGKSKTVSLPSLLLLLLQPEPLLLLVLVRRPQRLAVEPHHLVEVVLGVVERQGQPRGESRRR